MGKSRPIPEEEEEVDSNLSNGESKRPTSPVSLNSSNEYNPNLMTLKSARVWDIFSPPPVNSIKGHFLPKALVSNRRRRISVETHALTPPVMDGDGLNRVGFVSGLRQEDKVFVRILSPLSSKESKMAHAACNTAHHVVNTTTVKDPQGRRSSGFGRSGSSSLVSDDASMSTMGVDGVEDLRESEQGHDSLHDSTAAAAGVGNGSEANSLASLLPQFEWSERYKVPLRDLTINKRVSNVCVITTYTKKHKAQTREIIFATETDAREFSALVKQCKELAEMRSRKNMRSSLVGTGIRQEDKIHILVEIVSGKDLPVGDQVSSDPFVVVRMANKEIHRTRHISKTLDPIWTLRSGSLFLLSTTPKELFSCTEGIIFEVRDYDAVGHGCSLGAATVPAKTLFHNDGERIEFKLRPLPGKTNFNKGILAIRSRHATTNDIKFMKEFRRNKDHTDLYSGMADEVTRKLSTPTTTSLTSLFSTSSKTDADGTKKLKIKPGPDPKNSAQTEWLTESQIESFSFQPSHSWVDAGSGTLGKLYVEVLGCDKLPNKDKGGAFGNKTDSFISIIYEDCIVNTDVISDSLAPRWLPWTQRAFIFHMMHTSSQIFVGVFDYDPSIDDHDFIGRVAVDISNLTPMSNYILKYNLYTSATFTKRKACGTVTLRIRIELPDQRQALLTNLAPPPPVHVNVKTKKESKVVRAKIFGKYDMGKYGMKNINSYIEEILTYRQLLLYAQDAIFNVLLWRGHFDLPIYLPSLPQPQHPNQPPQPFLQRFTTRKTISLPLHSVNAFILGITIVEHPTLLPSFFFGSIAWLMLAVMEWRRRNPNPWDRCKSIWDLTTVLLFGTSNTPPHKILPNENLKAVQAFNKEWEERVAMAEKAAQMRYEENIKLQDEYQKQMEEIEGMNADISTKHDHASLDPFKPILYPIQQNLAILCDILRFSKNVVIWQECYYAYWLTVGSMLLSFACFFVPWGWIVKWINRILVWLLLGPWMKLVDVFYFSTMGPMTEADIDRQLNEARLKQRGYLDTLLKQAQINNENGEKLRDMKSYMFGKYITKVPILKLDRFRDVPLPESTAEPYRHKPLSMAELAMQEAGKDRTRVPGQHLVGDMIPVLETPPKTEAPKGQPTGRPSLLPEDGPYAYLTGGDSNLSAVTKVASVAVAALALTFLGVPLMISTVRWIMNASFWRAIVFWR